MKFDVIVIDLLNLYHRNFAVHEDLTHEINSETVKVGGIFGTLQSIQRIKRDMLNEGGIVYILNDNPTSVQQQRKLIDSEYKINRIPRSSDFYRGLDYLAMIFQSYSENMFYIQVPKLEADDLLPVVIDMNQNKSVLLCSSDMDWARGIDYNGQDVHWYNFKEVVTKAAFFDKYGFEPNESNIVQFKIYRGDSSDNIPAGMPNIGKDIVKQLLDYGSYEEIIQDIDILPFLSKTWKEKFRQNIGRLNLNYQLVSFIPVKYEKIKEFIIPCKYQPHTLKTFYEGLGFKVDKVDVRVYRDTQVFDKKKPHDDFFMQPPKVRI